MRNRKNVIIVVMIAVALLMATGYAFFASKLNINATGSISSTWNVYFEKIEIYSTVGKAEKSIDPSVMGTTATMGANLSLPGDSITYKLILKNGGSVPAIIEDVKAKAEGSTAIIFSIEGVKKGDKLAGNTSKEMLVTIEYDEVTSQPKETSKLLTVTVNAVQDTGQKVDEEDIYIDGQDPISLSTAMLGKNNSNIVNIGDGLYVSTATNDGSPTYYYKGNVTNNYVDFAGLTWRVVRINEDGTIKLILDDRINDTSYQFNPNRNNYKYMYYSESNVTNGIKNTIDNWYNNTLKTNYDSYIATTSFCESAKVKIDDSSTSGNATMKLSSSYTPNFECPLDGNGKQYVNEKAGLITADEAAMAGIPLYYSGMTSSEYNQNTYLQNSRHYWTLSPAGFSPNNGALAWDVLNYGSVSNYYVLGHDIVRPVISLNADTLVTGSGASDDMWVVQMK